MKKAPQMILIIFYVHKYTSIENCITYGAFYKWNLDRIIRSLLDEMSPCLHFGSRNIVHLQPRPFEDETFCNTNVLNSQPNFGIYENMEIFVCMSK